MITQKNPNYTLKADEQSIKTAQKLTNDLLNADTKHILTAGEELADGAKKTLAQAYFLAVLKKTDPNTKIIFNCNDFEMVYNVAESIIDILTEKHANDD